MIKIFKNRETSMAFDEKNLRRSFSGKQKMTERLQTLIL